MTDDTAPEPAPRWLDATQQTAWRGLLAIVSRAFPEFERTLKAHDLLTVHYQIFAALSEAPDRTLRLSELADGADMSQSRLTHRIRVLVERGEVAITADPDDRRAKNATLTDAGMTRLETIAPLHVEDVQRLIFDPLTPEQTTALADAMSTIGDHICQHPEYLNPRPGS
ncbi:MAG: MarR family transcriptional regulator [Actinomycetota bacterium]